MLSRAAAGALVIAVLVLGPVGPASAAWSVTAVGAGRAGAGALAAVTSVSAGCPSPTSAPLITWSASPQATGYLVERSLLLDGIWAVAGSTTSLSMSDMPPLPGEYRWRVTATRSAWSATATTTPESRVVTPLPTCL